MLQPYPQWHFHVYILAHKHFYPISGVYCYDRRHLIQHQHRRMMVVHLCQRHEHVNDNGHAVDDLWIIFVIMLSIKFSLFNVKKGLITTTLMLNST